MSKLLRACLDSVKLCLARIVNGILLNIIGAITLV